MPSAAVLSYFRCVMMKNTRLDLSLRINKQLLFFSHPCACAELYLSLPLRFGIGVFMKNTFFQWCVREAPRKDELIQNTALIWVFFCILVLIAVSPSDLGGIPLGDNNEYSWGLTWGLQGESVQAARLSTAGRPVSLCALLLPSLPGPLSLLHANSHWLYGPPHWFYSRALSTHQH